MALSTMARTAPPRTTRAPIYDSSAFRFPFVHEAQELWRYRYLVRNLVSRDLKIRYKRSSIGFIWVMLNPLLTMTVMTLVFGQLFRRFGVEHYSAYLLGGTLMWSVFAQGTNAAMAGLQGNAPILRKLYVPPSVFICAAIGSALVNFLFALAPFLALSLIVGVAPSLNWAYLLLPAALVTIFSLGIGLVVGAMIVFFQDIFEIYQVLVNAYYFLTPIFYPVTALPEPIRSFEQFNPMYLFVTGFRAAVLQPSLPGPAIMLPALGIAVGTLLVGWLIFTKVENKFAYHF